MRHILSKVFYFRLWVGIFLVVSLASLSAQEIDPFGKKITDIKFKGLVNLPPNRARSMVTSWKGKILQPIVPDAIQSELQKTGYFDQVDIFVDEVTEKGVLLIVEVIEHPIVGNINIIGSKSVNVTSKYPIKKGEPYNAPALADAELFIKEEYLKKGYLEIDVKSAPVEVSPGLMDINVNVNEGMPQVVQSINFEGLVKLEQDPNYKSRVASLKKKLKQAQQGVFQKGIYMPDFVSIDRQAVVSYLNTLGFVDASVENVRIDRNPDPKNRVLFITITFVIKEGEQWMYGGVEFVGNSIFSNEELANYFNGLVIGEILNKEVFMRSYAEGLQSRYQNDGYIYNQYDLTEQRDALNRMIKFVINIRELDRAHVESITFNGQKKTKDNVLNRELATEAGDSYAFGKVMQSYKNLMATGYFSQVTPDVTPGSQPGLVGVTFNLEEARTAQVMFGVTISPNPDSFPISGNVSLGDTNFLGRGYNVTLDAKASPDTAELSTSFYNPRLLDGRWGLGFNMGYRYNRYDTPQDTMYPIFDTEDIPDPYTGGYVFTSGDNKGQYFSDIYGRAPTDQEIKDQGLMQDYQYFGRDSDYMMTYESHEIFTGISTGYVHPLFYGYLRFNTGFNISFDYVNYDSDAYRPAYAEVRDGYKSWVFNDGLWFKLAWDARDNPSQPKDGFILSQRFYIAGGILGGDRTYLQSQTRLDYYYAFPKIHFSEDKEKWSMDWYLKIHSAFSSTVDQFGIAMRNEREGLYTLDGMFIGPGWSDYGDVEGHFLWESRVQLSMALVDNLLYWDNFVDMVMLWEDGKQLSSLSTWYNNFYGGIGTGIRLGIPSFPIGFYLIKRFRVDQNGVNWNPTRYPTIPAPAALDLALVFAIDLY